MTGRGQIGVLLVTGLVALVLFRYGWQGDAGQGNPAGLSVPDGAADSASADTGTPANNAAEPAGADNTTQHETRPAPEEPQALQEAAVDTVDTNSDPLPASVDTAGLGMEPLTDAEHVQLVDQLRASAALRAELFAQMGTETDPERLGRLARLLGDAGDPALAEQAARLVASGVPSQSAAAFEMLRQAQPNDPAARSLALDYLGSASDDKTLVSALDVLAQPAGDAQSRAQVAGQVITLTQHENPRVRDYSLSMLGRWSASPDIVPTLSQALQDEDPMVRESAAYALAEHPDRSAEITASLFAVAENDQEVRLTRLGAIHALKQRSLGENDIDRLRLIIQAMNGRRP